MFGEGGLGKKKKGEEADLDITPMIDVTFLLLIFFMVTSTMQGTPDKDIPPSTSGTNANASAFLDLSVAAPASAGAEGEITLDGTPLTLEQLKAEIKKEAQLGEVSLMIYAERDVKSGFIGEIEGIIGEVAKEEEAQIDMKFAVRDRR